MTVPERNEGATVVGLLARARTGDPQARESLFRACRSYLQVLARVQIEQRLQAKADASDLVQETLLDAHRDLSRFEGSTEKEWLSWLRGILRHNAADLVRRYRGTAKREEKRERRLATPEQTTAAPRVSELRDDQPTPSQVIVRRERELQIAEALTRLSPQHQEVVFLRNVRRLPFQEVAAKMDRTRPAAQMLWMRALQSLEAEMRRIFREEGA